MVQGDAPQIATLPHVWTSREERVAAREGWRLVGAGTPSGCIECIDDAPEASKRLGFRVPALSDDTRAWFIVITRALDVSFLHRKALSLIGEDERRRIAARHGWGVYHLAGLKMPLDH